ncbi:efflux RND transporter periplasmic adaptor subunit [Xylophilus sp. Leaf220]|uniref:efflux RND transporter periplasmic adaptor subunit n=1 Tax=Xylophilus sp. Leaf220 TaxID=1735686 RepID=UPI0006F35C24|nr:efflux RND transporter periplasmic adaptor subunit [Xylophilus sp. Leaf220]KQM70260.1 RND transporter [Xylophilus sp. Leaf220]
MLALRDAPPRLSLTPTTLAVAAVLVLLLAGCGKKDAAPAAGAPPGGGMPPPQVGVVTVQLGDVGLVTELPGRVEASRIAQVRARAAGVVQKRLFKEGSDVKAGQPLFQIDSAPYAATFQSAQASLARAEANLSQATATAERYKPLVEANAISRQDYVNAQATQKQAAADVAVARAGVQTAKINLDYASVTAPIAGRIGRALVTEGALVGQGESTQLAVIQQIDPVYVNFTQSATEVMKLRNALQSGKFKRASGAEAASIRVVLEDGSEYGRDGRLLFSDLTVDSTTGQITLRAEVPNPTGQLLPGLYVRVRLEQAQAKNAILLPQQAVTRTTDGDTVTLVDAEGKMSKRKVVLGDSKGASWVVLDGLKGGEQVMVDGFQKLQMLPPGAPVKPVPWTPPAPQGAAPAAPAQGTAAPAAGAPAAADAGSAAKAAEPAAAPATK